MKILLKFSLICCLSLTTFHLHAHSLIINPSNATAELSRNTLRAIFAMRKHYWEDGTEIKVFVLDDTNALHTEFCKTALGMFPYQLRRLWDRQVFSGTGTTPITVKSIEEMQQRVASTAGAIGYAETDSVSPNVKLLGRR